MKKIIIILIVLLVSTSSYSLENKHEISPQIMLDNADSMRALTLGAIQYAYHINDTFWIGADGFFGRTVVDGGSGLVVTNGQKIWAAAPTFYYNMPALLGATEENPQGSQAHLYTSVGVGYLQIGNEEEIYGLFGGGMVWISKLKWLGVRVDVKGLFYMLDNTNGSAFNSDFALSVGPSFVF